MALDPTTNSRVLKATTDLSTLTVTMLNEASVGLYRVHEHVQAKVPQLAKHKGDLEALEQSVSAASKAVADSREAIRDLQLAETESFGGLEDLGHRLRKLLNGQ